MTIKQRKFCKKIYNKKAFSLVEISVVIVIVSLIISSFFVLSKSNHITSKRKDTHKKITKIYNSLKYFVAQNNRIPCPAPINQLYSEETYGQEGISTGVCQTTTSAFYSSGNIIIGLVPVKTLGLSVEDSFDGFDSKLLYVIDKRFAESASNFDIITSGDLVVKQYISSTNTTTRNAILAIVSFGENKLGAFNKNSLTQIEQSSNVDEIENSLTSVDVNFFSFSNRSGNDFDDIVFFKDKKDFLLDSRAYFLDDTNNTESNN